MPVLRTSARACYHESLRKLVLALLSAACVVSTHTDLTAGDYDLTDPDLLTQLGAAQIEEIDWERRSGSYRIFGVGTPADPAEIDLIGAALSDLPQALTAQVEARQILRVEAADLGDRIHPDALAFSKGPDVFLMDRLFAERPHRLDVTRAYVHELTHVAQFYALDPDYITAVVDGEVDQVDPANGSGLVMDFAAATGWEDRSGLEWEPAWSLDTNTAASTGYGRLGPHEDMAEAVALAAVGRGNHLPADRGRWVEQWLGVDLDRLAGGRPFIPAGSEEVLAAEPLYDQDRVDILSARVDHVEPVYWNLPANLLQHEELAQTIETELRQRSLTGRLERLDDPRLPRYGGEFSGAGGLSYWVELWDFREADLRDGPRHPVLTYVVFW